MYRPASNLNLRECFRGGHVCLTEVACRPEKPERLPERAMPVHAILFQRWGAWVMHRGRQQTLIDPTRVVLFNPGEPYTASHPAGCADDCDFIGINPGIVRDALRDLGREREADAGPVFPFDTAPIDVRLLARQRLVFRLALVLGGADPLLAEEETLALVRAVLAAPLAAAGTRPPRIGPRAARARAALAGVTRAFLAENFRRRLTLNDISDAVESSPFHLCRVFKSAAGCSIHEHLTRLRLAASLRDLEAGAGDLQQLALSLGLHSHSHFTGLFRARVGMTPSRFREAMRRAERRAIRGALERLSAPPTRGRSAPPPPPSCVGPRPGSRADWWMPMPELV